MSAPKELVVASHNAGKLREIEALLAPLAIRVTSAGVLHLPEPEETGATFEENALLKAETAVRGCGLPALADDSGLVVPGLGGAPGIYSARWAGPQKDFTAAMARVERELGAKAQGAPAFFVCVLALAQPGAAPLVVRGEAHGTLTFPPRGTRGFGYDPIFLPQGGSETFGEMQPEAKHNFSHRAIAFTKLLEVLQTERAA